MSEGFVKICKFANKFYGGKTQKACKPFFIGGKQVGVIPGFVMNDVFNHPEVFNVVTDLLTGQISRVNLCSTLSTYDEKSEKLAEVLQQWRKKDSFLALKGWRDECYDVWDKFSEPALLKMERSATSLFGVKQYGVHINGYVNHPDDGLCMWLGKRSANKPTWPNMYDQMAAGGLAAGLGITECAKKEAREEASVPDDVLEKLKPAGTVSYMYEDERGIFPECQYVFDLEVPLDFTPVNTDGEVESFQLFPIDKVKEMIIKDDFKFNCAIVCLDFMIRHGIISPDAEPNYSFIMENIHKPLP